MIDTLIHRWLQIPYTLNVRRIRRPRGAKQTFLFIHGIGASGDHWQPVIDKLPDNIRIVTIDLLGFGDSPAPKWAIYNAKTQARSILATIVKLRIRTPLVIVGHSLGALVAIEVAKRYPLLVNRLILCSPPLYNDQTRPLISEKALRKLYTTIKDHPEQFLHLSELGFKYKLLRGEQYLNDTNVDSYVAALEASIINQTSLADSYNLKVPTLMLKGSFDPLIVPKNLTQLARGNKNITVRTVLSSHDIKGRMIGAVVKAVKESVD